MNRRQLFLSTAKTALATALGGSWLVKGSPAAAQATAPAPGGVAASPAPVGNAIGSPAGTRTIPGDVLPPLDLPWGGTANLNAVQSTPWWQPRVVPPAGAPNILLIMTDDVGFGAPGTFGGVIPTPNLDRIADNGLRYTQFHSTALCSPSRAALITGRNHHAAGFGVVSEQATGYPGYDSVISRDVATIDRIVREHGYATSWFGKDHSTPAFQASQAGPFDQWPIGMGFECTKVVRPPWDVAGPTNLNPADNVTWELSDITKDWTQFEDVATKYPEKLRELQDLFWIEANKHQGETPVHVRTRRPCVPIAGSEAAPSHGGSAIRWSHQSTRTAAS
ncbi:MAG: sulfatase-like hydrolase/transferase [Acetobacteraceae bacterium]